MNFSSIMGPVVSTVETWRPIPDWEGFYEASTWGRIRSVNRELIRSNGKPMRVVGRILKPALDAGYLKVALCVASKLRSFRVHTLVANTLVANTYHGPRPAGKEVDHADDNRVNCRPSNLQYLTHAANNAKRDRSRMGKRGSKNNAAVLTEAKVRQLFKLRKRGYKLRELVAYFGCSRSTVKRVLYRHCWTHVEVPK